MKTVLQILVSFIIGFILGWYLFKGTDSAVSIYQNPEWKLDSIKIDSLERSNKNLTSLNDSLKEELGLIDTVRIIEIEKLDRLPLDSNLSIFKRNLEKYEKKYKK